MKTFIPLLKCSACLFTFAALGLLLFASLPALAMLLENIHYQLQELLSLTANPYAFI